jgi:predicted transcriptional regulator
MRPVLDDIRFLADSNHRVVAMAELIEGSRSRAELRGATGASSATVGRLLTDFERREWLTQDGIQYTLTPLGRFAAREFASVYGRLRVARELRALLSDFPPEVMEFGIGCLAAASATWATPENPLAMAARIREYEHDSLTSLSLTDFFPEPCIDGRHDAVVNGEQTFEAVFSPGVVEAAMASHSAEKFVELVTADQSDISITTTRSPRLSSSTTASPASSCGTNRTPRSDSSRPTTSESSRGFATGLRPTGRPRRRSRGST